jgi:ribulose-phosphate 3-epimerase
MEALTWMREERRLNFRIEVDGGVGLDTVGDVVRAGGELLVAGSAVFGHGDVKQNARALLEAARSAKLSKT